MSPVSLPATLYRRDECILGEGPFWHEGQLWWVDIERGLLLSADLHGNLIQQVHFGQRIGAATPTAGRNLLVALEREIAVLHVDSKKWQTIVRPDNLPDVSRFNDGKCDPVGRWIIGTMSHDHSKTSSLYSLHHDHSLDELRGDISISNGLAWSADGGTLYYIDTRTLCVLAYDYTVGTGSISKERVVLRFPEEDGWPDGMTIDRDERLWIAFWDGWSVRCYQPKTGVCEAIIPLPCSRPTSCCFGGADLNRLFITTACLGLDEKERLEQPLAGSLFICDLETPGWPTSIFAGNPHEVKSDRLRHGTCHRRDLPHQ